MKGKEFVPGKTFWVNAFYGAAAKELDVDKEIKLDFEDYINVNYK